MRSLRNISNMEATIKEPVVANNATASTVAFIAPGPPNPPITQVSVSSLLLSWVYFLHLPSSTSFLPTRAISCRAPPPPLLAAPFTSPPLSSTAGQLSIERQPIRPVRAHPTPTSGRDPDLWSPCVHVAGTQAHYHKTYGAHTLSRHLNQDLGRLVGTFYSTTYVQLGDQALTSTRYPTRPELFFATRTRPELLLKSSEFRVFPSRLLQIF